VLVLDDINLTLDEGQFVAVVGKSGSGKSTLLNLMAGIDRPSAGRIHVGDTAVHSLSENQLAVWRGRNLGFVFQFFQLLSTLTIVENIMLPMDFAGILSTRDARQRAMALLERVGLASHAAKFPSALSGGEQQRAAIARAIANDPPLIVADEPTGNLDSATTGAIVDLLGSLVRAGKTVVMVTHDDEILGAVDRVVHLADGKIVAAPEPARAGLSHA